MGYKFNFVTPEGTQVGTNSPTVASDLQYVKGYKPVKAEKKVAVKPAPKPRPVEVQAPETK